MKNKDAAKNVATKKAAIKRIAAAVLSFAVAFTFMPWGAFDSYAESNQGTEAAVVGAEKAEVWSVSINGIEAKKVIETKDGYTYLDMNGNPQLTTLYTVVLDKAADKAKLTFDRDSLVYNYNLKGDYLAGWYEDYTKGLKEYEVDIDSNGDFAPDAIQVQNPYNEDWTGGEIRYAVTFKYATDKLAAKAIASKLCPSVKAKQVGKKVKLTATAGKLANVKEQGFTVKYKFYRSKKKASGYVLAKTQKSNAYTFKKGTKNKKYYYKAKVCIYKDGKLLASTPLSNCKYVSKKWK